MKPLRVAVSIDVEDYWMSPESIPVSASEKFEDRIEVGMYRLLELFRELGHRSTFFFLGCIAERHPGLVQACFEAGHEIGTHTWDHRPLNRLPLKEQARSVKKSIEVLQEITGAAIVGIRAPEFAVARNDFETIRMLADLGIKYDSSINPFGSYLYGEPGAPRHPYLLDAEDGRKIVELPPASARLLGKTLPAGGGFFLRALPVAYFRWAIGKINREGHTAVLYIHPWEFDPDHPKDLPIRRMQRWIHYLGLSGMMEKTRRLLEGCECALMREVMDESNELD